MRVHRIAAIPGDGIGREVISAGLEVLDVCASRDGGFRLDVEHFDWGSDYYRKHGLMMPADGLDRLRGKSAIYVVNWTNDQQYRVYKLSLNTG
ncbi:MAG: isocitrate/isopropylmalate family dehydrogenase, partial [Xanthobacteraceae bacterium]